jgi:hypothetical protein
MPVKARWLAEQAASSLRLVGEVSSALKVRAELRGAYAGWLGHGNLGDEAIFEAVSRELAPLHLRHFAGVKKERVLAGLFGLRKLYRFGILGGGTLILGGYAGHLEPLLDSGLQCHAYGTGVLDPDEVRLSGGSCDISRWVRVLKQMGTIHVRGPRSKRTLTQLGIKDVEVSGDPALLHALKTLPPCPGQSVLGVSFFLPRHHYGRSTEFLFEAIRDACSWALKQGWMLRLFPVSSEDLADSIRLSTELKLPPGIVHPFYANAAGFIQEAAACRLFLGVRLHSVILAHCAYVPAVMIGYEAKCFDYMSSIGMEEWTLRSDQCESRSLILLLQAAEARQNEMRAALFARVASLNCNLRAVAKNILLRHAPHSTVFSTDGTSISVERFPG